jgi:hypothetical protein
MVFQIFYGSIDHAPQIFLRAFLGAGTIAPVFLTFTEQVYNVARISMENTLNLVLVTVVLARQPRTTIGN